MASPKPRASLGHLAKIKISSKVIQQYNIFLKVPRICLARPLPPSLWHFAQIRSSLKKCSKHLGNG